MDSDSNSDSSFVVRNMVLEDLDAVMQWSAKEDWQITYSDLKAFLLYDPKGTFIGELDGKPIACIFTVKFEDYSTTMCLYVQKEYRSNKYAQEIYETALMYCFDVNIRQADVKPNTLKKANHLGYQFYCDLFTKVKKAEKTIASLPENLVDVREVDPELLRAYDTAVYGYDRKGYSKIVMEEKNNKGLVAMKDGKIVGYGLLRLRFKDDSYSVGPLYADDKETAELLMDGLQSLVVGKDCYVVVFKVNDDAMDIFKDWNLHWTEHRVYDKDPSIMPKLDKKRIYSSYE